MIKKIKKINSTIDLHVLYVKKRMYILPTFHDMTQIIKKVFLLMNPNVEGGDYLAVKKFISIIKMNNVKTFW